MNLRALLLLVSLFAAAGCHGYYPRWHYAPAHEVHVLHLQSDGDPTAVVSARIVGVLRPEESQPRRLHARLEVENRSAEAIALDPSRAQLRASGGLPLIPSESATLNVPAHEARRLDLHFALPDEPSLLDSALDEVELAWPLEVGGRVVTTRALFHRASVWSFDEHYGYSGYDPFWSVRGDYPYGSRFDPWCTGPAWYGYGWRIR